MLSCASRCWDFAGYQSHLHLWQGYEQLKEEKPVDDANKCVVFPRLHRDCGSCVRHCFPLTALQRSALPPSAASQGAAWYGADGLLIHGPARVCSVPDAADVFVQLFSIICCASQPPHCQHSSPRPPGKQKTKIVLLLLIHPCDRVQRSLCWERTGGLRVLALLFVRLHQEQLCFSPSPHAPCTTSMRPLAEFAPYTG